MILKRNGEKASCCLILDLRKKAFSFSQLNIMLAADFLIDVLYQVEKLPLYF